MYFKIIKMDSEDQDEKPIRSKFLRHRSPTFSKKEIQTLVNLVAMHKSILTSKCTNNVALHAKKLTWLKITKVFNSKGFTHQRHVDCLKLKWVKLKKEAKKVSRNYVEDGHGDFDELTTQVLQLLCEAENNTNEISVPKELEDECNELHSDKPEEVKNNAINYWDKIGKKEEIKPNDPNLRHNGTFIRYKKRKIRSMNFDPHECRLLLQCVKPEKKYVLCNETSTRALMLKHRAWSRITANFNNQNSHKRPKRTLWNKFKNIKKSGRWDDVPDDFPPRGNKHEYEEYSVLQKEDQVKTEPVYALDDEIENGVESDSPDDNMASNSDQNGDSFDRSRQEVDNIRVNIEPDPLSILNGDSGIGSINIEPFYSESSKVTKLKLELLKYQLDNAKLERKRIEDASLAEAKLNETRATESAIRLRAARLECEAAAARLPPAHPALHYSPEETRAQHYMEQFHAN